MALTIKFADGDVGKACPSSLKCSACGGRPPYTWTATNNVVITPSIGALVTVSPPTNSGGTGAHAYIYSSRIVNNATGGCCTDCVNCRGPVQVSFDCNGDPYRMKNFTGTVCGGATCPSADPTMQDIGTPKDVGCPPTNNIYPHWQTFVGSCQPFYSDCCQGVLENIWKVADVRTQGMKDAGCYPCVAVMEGAILTVTDADGNSTARVLKGV